MKKLLLFLLVFCFSLNALAFSNLVSYYQSNNLPVDYAGEGDNYVGVAFYEEQYGILFFGVYTFDGCMTVRDVLTDFSAWADGASVAWSQRGTVSGFNFYFDDWGMEMESASNVNVYVNCEYVSTSLAANGDALDRVVQDGDFIMIGTDDVFTNEYCDADVAATNLSYYAGTAITKPIGWQRPQCSSDDPSEGPSDDPSDDPQPAVSNIDAIVNFFDTNLTLSVAGQGDKQVGIALVGDYYGSGMYMLNFGVYQFCGEPTLGAVLDDYFAWASDAQISWSTAGNVNNVVFEDETYGTIGEDNMSALNTYVNCVKVNNSNDITSSLSTLKAVDGNLIVIGVPDVIDDNDYCDENALITDANIYGFSAPSMSEPAGWQSNCVEQSDPTALTDVEDSGMRYNNGILYCSKASALDIYDVMGRRVISQNMKENGALYITLPRGCYVAKTETGSLKFVIN